MRKTGIVFSILSAIVFMAISPASALDKGGIILYGGPVIAPIVGGDASDGDDAPGYDDLFNTGAGPGMDGMLAVSRYLRVGGGFSVLVFTGDDLDDGDVSKWWVAPMMLGVQFFPLKWERGSLRPYLRLDMGMAYLSGVKVDGPEKNDDARLFTTSTEFAGDVGIGLEWLFKSNWGVFLDIRYMMVNHPMEGGGIPITDPDPVAFLPISLGVSYTY